MARIFLSNRANNMDHLSCCFVRTLCLGGLYLWFHDVGVLYQAVHFAHARVLLSMNISMSIRKLSVNQWTEHAHGNEQRPALTHSQSSPSIRQVQRGNLGTSLLLRTSWNFWMVLRDIFESPWCPLALVNKLGLTR